MHRSTHAPRRTAAAFSLALALGLGLSSCGEVAAPEAGPGASTTGETSAEEPTPTEPTADESASTETDGEKPTRTVTDPSGSTSAGEDATTGPAADGEADGPIASPCGSPDDPSLEGLTVAAGDAGPAAVDKAQQLLDLAVACDRDGLVALAGQDGTLVSLGATQPQEAFVSAPDADERIHAMVVVLSALEPATSDEEGPAHVRWPGLPDGLDDTAAARLVELGLYDADEVAMMEGFGAYTGWRVVVDEEGRWTFMGAGE